MVIKSKNIRLAIFHVDCVVLLDGLKHMVHGRGNYARQGWAQIGQVGLTWTNIGPKELCLGLTIQVKVLGQLKLERKLFGDR